MQGSEDKDISDPTYSLADIRVQLSGGRMRWFATILALAGVALLVSLLCALSVHDSWI